MNGRGDRDRGLLGLGLVLIVLGLLFFGAETMRLDWEQYGWPIYVIAPGLFMLVAGLAIGGEGGLGLAIPGGIVTTVGLVLAYQRYVDDYASWSYAWALVAPGSVGATLLVYGLVHRRADLFDDGLRTAAVGLGLFIGFGLFFENLLGIGNGTQSGGIRSVLPFLAVLLGLLIVASSLMPRRQRLDRPSLSDTWHDDPGTPAGDSTAPRPPSA